MILIKGSVGQEGKNNSAEVKSIQNLLNKTIHLIPETNKLVEDGIVGQKTIAAIAEYQKYVVKLKKPDGRVDPHGLTLKSLNTRAKKHRPANVTVFINNTLKSAKLVKKTYGIPISILIAQAALESGWGRHVKDNAFFGIKAHKTRGSTTSFKTTEFINGKKVQLSDSFRAYKNFNEAALDYGRFLTTNPRYKLALTHKNNPLKFAELLQRAGYATDPLYAKKLKTIISSYYLDEYDQ